MKIGIIKYRKYDERVLLGEYFIIDDLFNIILNDADYVKFQIVDEMENLVLSTDWKEKGESVAYLGLAKVKREEEILWSTYNAYKTPSMIHKTKVTWKVDCEICRTKKEAHKYADKINLKARLLIEQFIGRRSIENN